MCPMKRNALFLSLLAGLAVGSALQARDFTRHLPAGSLFVLQTYDLPAQTEAHAEVPAMKALKQMDWKTPLAFWYDQMLLSAEMSEDVPVPTSGEEFREILDILSDRFGEILSHLNGNLALAVGDFQEPMRVFREHQAIRRESYGLDEAEPGQTPEDSPELMEQEEALGAAEMRAIAGELIFMADVKEGQQLMDKISGWMTDMLQKQTEEEGRIELQQLDWDGTPVYTLASTASGEDEDGGEDLPSLWWTAQDGVWMLAGTETALRDAIASLTTPPENPLAQDPAYQDSIAFLEEQDTVFYINLPRLDPLMRNALIDDDAAPDQGPNGMSPAKIMDWLGLDALLPYAIGLRMDSEAMTGRGRLGFSRETPLSRILVEPGMEPVPTPAFLHRDFGQVSTVRMSIGRMIRQLEKEMTTLDPQIAMGVTMGKAMLNGQIGMDIQTQFLDHFGDTLITVQETDTEAMQAIMEASRNEDPQATMEIMQRYPTGGQNYLIAVQVNNLQAVSGAMNTLLALLHPSGLPEPEMFRGHPIHNPMPPGGGASSQGMMRYTFLDNYLLVAVGNPTLLHKAITASNEPGDRLANDPEYLALRDRFPDAQYVDYASGAQQAASWNIMNTSFSSLMTDAQEMPDLSALRDSVQGSISVMTRQGTVYEAQSITTFQESE